MESFRGAEWDAQPAENSTAASATAEYERDASVIRTAP
jgi:hypothetical protein